MDNYEFVSRNQFHNALDRVTREADAANLQKNRRDGSILAANNAMDQALADAKVQAIPSVHRVVVVILDRHEFHELRVRDARDAKRKVVFKVVRGVAVAKNRSGKVTDAHRQDQGRQEDDQACCQNDRRQEDDQACRQAGHAQETNQACCQTASQEADQACCQTARQETDQACRQTARQETDQACCQTARQETSHAR